MGYMKNGKSPPPKPSFCEKTFKEKVALADQAYAWDNRAECVRLIDQAYAMFDQAKTASLAITGLSHILADCF